MYYTYVTDDGWANVDPEIRAIDGALMRLRRVWDAPAGVAHEGDTVDGSTLLICLALADRQPVDIGGTAAVLNVTHSTASRLVARATEAGMIERGPGHNRRQVLLHLTPAGRRLVAASRRFRGARLAHQLAAWRQDDLATLADLLVRLADDLHGDHSTDR